MRSPFDPSQAVSNTMFYGMDTARALQHLYTCVDTYAFVYILEPLHDEHNNSKATMWEAGGGVTAMGRGLSAKTPEASGSG